MKKEKNLIPSLVLLSLIHKKAFQLGTSTEQQHT